MKTRMGNLGHNVHEVTLAVAAVYASWRSVHLTGLIFNRAVFL